MALAVPDCPALHDWDEDTLIKSYFKEGYTYSQICAFLELRHGIVFTLDQLRGRLKKLNLKRRGEEVDTPLHVVSAAILKERGESGRDIGYRVLHQRLTQKYNFVVGRDVVMMLSAVTDPVGVKERKKQCLKRRVYHSKGPNYIWHVDGYDKLKPFGFPIHGCIDGYSRRILWLHVSPSNNDPYVVAGFYLDCITKVGGCPRILRTDRGTENTNLAFLQPFLRDGDDEFAKEKSFMYGRSTSNQRIEAWWGQLRKNVAGWWKDYLKTLRMNGEFDDSNDVHIDCLWFCFMDLIQAELATVAHEWNTHRIRASSESPGGIPDVLYFLPENEDTNDYICPVDVENLLAAEEYSISKPEPVVAEFIDLANAIMEENGILSKPKNTDDALKLYHLLKHALE